MNCKKCGFILTNQNKNCPNCGEPNELYVEEIVPTVEPVQPTAPVEPVAPVVPVEPVQPVTPTQDVEPLPTAGVEPTPSDPVQAAPIQQMPSQPAPAAPVQKKNNIPFIILIIVLGVVIIGLGVFIAIKLLGGNGSNSGKTNSEVNNNTNGQESKTDEDKPSTKSNDYTFKGYTFTIPTGFVLDKSGGYDAFVGTNIFFGDLDINNVDSYAAVKANLSTVTQYVLSSWTQSGFAYVEEGEATIGNKTFLYIQFYNTTKNLYGDTVITAMPDGSLLLADLFYKNLDIATEGYKGIGEFANSAVKDTSSDYSSESSTFDNTLSIDPTKIELD